MTDRVTVMILKVTAKCSDMFSASVIDQGKVIGAEYSGYVPGWFPNPQCNHYGDYVELDIEVETGKIVNWKKPSRAQIEVLTSVK